LPRNDSGARDPKVPGTPRARRSTEEVRSLVLASARRLFSLYGYGGTSTRDIANDAGVTAPAIYRHFGSKEGLFEAAVEEPLHVAVDGFLQDWEFLGPDRANNAAAVRLYMKSLVSLLRDNRELITAYLHNRSHSDQEESVLSYELSSVVDRVQSAITDQGLVGVDVHVVVRCVTGMVLALVLYDDFLFPPNDHPSNDRILNEVVALTLRGIESRDAPA
jgi:AcrR family transcriptional regulator